MLPAPQLGPPPVPAWRRRRWRRGPYLARYWQVLQVTPVEVTPVGVTPVGVLLGLEGEARDVAVAGEARVAQYQGCVVHGHELRGLRVPER